MKLGLEAVTLRFQVRVMAGKKLVWSGIRPLQQVDLLRDKVNLFNVVKFELNPVCGCRVATLQSALFFWLGGKHSLSRQTSKNISNS